MAFFEVLHQDKRTRARTGRLYTDHGVVNTPIFMPVGTQGAVKTLDQTDLEQIGAEIILGNTYHLHLRPGEELVARHGGLHRFMNWPHAILTDSGGFQVFSLGLQKEKKTIGSQARLVAIDGDGVTFTSHLDGSEHRFTPEKAIATQHKIGADIIMAFDECTPDDAPRPYVEQALRRTHAWATRCLVEHKKNTSLHGYRQFLFGIIQGARYRDLRELSAGIIASLGFDGIAIGGESIGYNMTATAEILDWVHPHLPSQLPHYAMGVGLTPLDLLLAVEHGIDMFDCVAPTRLARHGVLYCRTEKSMGGTLTEGKNRYRLNIKNAAYRGDTHPIDPACICPVCHKYSRSYLHHLFAADELSGLRLGSIHNLHFLLQLMRETRQAINEDRFTEFKNEWIK